MSYDAIQLVTRPKWIGAAADAIGDAVKHAYAAGGERGLRLKSLLNGVWLNHPLHAAITDVPIGAWTVAVTCDAAGAVTGRPDLDGCARIATAIGVAGAVASAAAGVTDWSDTDGESRRVGFVHGTLNLTATTLFAVSLVERRRDPGRGRLSALLGYAVALTAAYLGGNLVYARRIGVSHAAGLEVPEEFTPVLPERELADRRLTRAMAGSTPVLLVRNGDTVHAIAETCSHLGGPLSEGTLTDGTVICPWHGSRFSLDDGGVVNGPATHAQPCFEARIHDGQIEVRMPRHGRASEVVGGAAAPTEVRVKVATEAGERVR